MQSSRTLTLRVIGVATLARCLIGCESGWAASEPTYGGHSMSYWVKRTDFVPFIDLNMHGEGGFAQRDQAFRALAAIGAPAVPSLCKILDNRALKWDRRWRAAETLGQIGKPAKSSLPWLVRALNDPTFSNNNRYSIVMSIVAIGAAGDSAADLTKFLTQRHAAVPLSTSSASDLDQSMTISALGHAGEPAKVAVPLLVGMLRDYQKAVSNPEAGRLPTGPEEKGWAIEARETLRQALVDALGELGVFDASALPAVLDSQSDPSDEVRLRVALALIKLGKHEVALPLIDALASDSKADMRRQVTETLGALAKRQSPASLPRLVKMLADSDDEVRGVAAENLGEMGPAGKPALGELKALAKDKSERVREAAQEAIAKIERTPGKR